MILLELIQLRCSTREADQVTAFLQGVEGRLTNSDLMSWRVFTSADFEGDLMIAIEYEAGDLNSYGSDVGRWISNELKALCLVNRSVWRANHLVEMVDAKPLRPPNDLKS